jgi:manganese efflux pump family protein
VLALLLLAVAVGLSNAAAAIGIGVSGIRGSTRVRVAVIFGLFEAGMPLLGLALGDGLATSLGQAARVLGGVALIAIGVVSLILARRGAVRAAHAHAGAHAHADAGAGAQADAGADPVPAGPRRSWGLGRVVVSGLALSADNLAAGFALGAFHTSLPVAAAVFGGVSVAMSLAGLELGAKIGSAAGDRSELVASGLLIAVGAAIAAGAL